MWEGHDERDFTSCLRTTTRRCHNRGVRPETHTVLIFKRRHCMEVYGAFAEILLQARADRIISPTFEGENPRFCSE